MIFLIVIGLVVSMYLFIPKGTNLHEIIRLPYYNYRAQTARKNDMKMERFAFGNHSRQYIVFFTPKDGQVTQNEVIVYIHGGGWTFGNPMMFRCNAQFFVDRGYAVVMPTYRRLPIYRSPAMKEDALLALNKTVAVMQSKGLGNKKLILGGLSSGGHLAALLAFDRLNWPDHAIPRDRLAGVMLLGAPLDLSKMARTAALWRLAGNRKSGLFEASNPVSYLTTEDSVPVLLVHGTKDGLVNYNSALSFADKFGSDLLSFYTVPGGTHLDSGYWIFEEGELRECVLDWLRGVGIDSTEGGIVMDSAGAE